MSNIFPIDFEEKLTMAQNDYILFSDSEDGNKIKKAQYKNLKGEPGTPGTPGKDGEDGAAATISVGTTTTGAAGSSASVTNSGTSSAAVFNFTIPQGAKGEPGEDGQDGADGAAATITVGTTTTLPAGSSATVTNVGTSQDAILNFGIPKGDAGTGSGDVNGPASSTDGDVALFDGATGKLIKDSGASLADYQEKLTAGTNIQISNNVISATGGSDIVYATQAEYNALLPGAASDNKHYFIYTASSRLPSAYQEVEYIQSSGTQYIDTGWYPSSNYCKVVLDGTLYLVGGDWSVFFGMTNGSNAYSLHTRQSEGKWLLNAGSSGNVQLGAFTSGTDGVFTVETNNGTYNVDIAGSTYTGSYNGSVAQSSMNMTIFAFNENGYIHFNTTILLREYKIYSGADTLARDFIPCYRIADSVIGLYDIENDQFYTNAGSGTFIKGSDV